MSRFTEFFKAKATQIAITAVSASLVVGASAGVAIHNNNKKLEAALYELTSTSTTESVTESSNETTTESTTESATASATKTTVTTTEPAGDRAIQYLAEYEKITREYEKKRAELENRKKSISNSTSSETLREAPTLNRDELYDKTQDERDEILDKHSSDLLAWVEESKNYEVSMSEYLDTVHSQENAIQKQIDELDKQYSKDINALRTKYGIIN